MKTTTFYFTLLGLLTLLTSGCTTVNVVEPAEPVGTRAMIDDRRIITDPSLARNLRIMGINETTVSNDMLQVQVEVVNTTRRVQSFNYAFEWYNLDGMLITTPPTTWKSRQIEGGESLFLTAVAPSPRAKDFRLKLLESVRR